MINDYDEKKDILLGIGFRLGDNNENYMIQYVTSAATRTGLKAPAQ
jgi:hypothetical protein